MFVLFWTSTLFNTEYFTNKIFYFFYHAVIVTGPADTVGPPESSVILGVAPNVNVYLSDVVTVILKPLEFSYVVKATPPGLPKTSLQLTLLTSLVEQ